MFEMSFNSCKAFALGKRCRTFLARSLSFEKAWYDWRVVARHGLALKFCSASLAPASPKSVKAAPRFELGIKDLQSSALPLGHAASTELCSFYAA